MNDLFGSSEQQFTPEQREAARKVVALAVEHGLLTPSKTNQVVIERFEKEDGAILRVVLTNGEPGGTAQCSSCKEILPADQFSYYQARVDRKGYLSRSNALCHRCASKLDKVRQAVFDAQKEDIPPKPRSGSRCPKCDRAWQGNWHRHHDYKTGLFVEWQCGQCNMAAQDRRVPEPYKEDQA